MLDRHDCTQTIAHQEGGLWDNTPGSSSPGTSVPEERAQSGPAPIQSLVPEMLGLECGCNGTTRPILMDIGPFKHAWVPGVQVPGPRQLPACDGLRRTFREGTPFLFEWGAAKPR